MPEIRRAISEFRLVVTELTVKSGASPSITRSEIRVPRPAKAWFRIERARAVLFSSLAVVKSCQIQVGATDAGGFESLEDVLEE